MRVRICPRLHGWKYYISHAEAMAVKGPVMLVRAPENEHHSNAIEVHFDGRHIGHIPYEVAEIVAPMIDEGHHFYATADVEDGGDFIGEYGQPVEWAHINITMTSDDMSDEDATRLCDKEDLPAWYLVGNDFCPAHRTRGDWFDVGRRVRRGYGPTRYEKIKKSWGPPDYISLYSFADLTQPKGAKKWPGMFK